MKDYLIKVNDIFNIGARLREIDDGYRLYFNNKEKRVEVHNLKNKGDTLSVVSPFNVIDKRLVDYVRRTRTEKAKELIEQIEKENEILEKRKEKVAISNAKDKVSELVKKMKY